MEHCRLLLLLLQRFPTAISSYGVCVPSRFFVLYLLKVFVAKAGRHTFKC